MKKSFKCIIIGTENTGKTALAERLARGEFLAIYKPTIGVDFKLWNLGHDRSLQLWDSSGCSRMVTLIPAYAVNSTVVLLAIDASQDLETQFVYLKEQLNQINHGYFRFYHLILTKADLQIDDNIKTKIAAFQQTIKTEFNIMVQSGITSSKDNSGVKTLYESILKNVRLLDGEVLTPPVAGSSEHDYLASLQNNFEQYLIERFSGLSTDFSLKHHPADRETAYNIFCDELNKIGSSAFRLATLVKVAEPFINRHSNPVADKHFGIKNTSHWKICLNSARIAGLTALKNQIDAKTISAECLSAWKYNSLFAAHRNNFRITGAFGKTRGQQQINELIANLPRPV